MEVEATDPTLLDDPSLQLHDPHPTNASRFPLKSHLLQKIEQEMEALRSGQRRLECLKMQLNRQCSLFHIMYVGWVCSGAHVVYLQKLALLEEEMRARVADAERERDVRIASIQALCDADCKQAEFQLQVPVPSLQLHFSISPCDTRIKLTMICFLIIVYDARWKRMKPLSS